MKNNKLKTYHSNTLLSSTHKIHGIKYIHNLTCKGVGVDMLKQGKIHYFQVCFGDFRNLLRKREPKSPI